MLKVFEAFAGIGTQSMALKRLGVDYEVVGIAEIDKFAIQSYMAIHGDTKNYGDISKIDPTELPDMDLFTYSFPCQDLSISGKQRGMGEGTRSGLLYECEKVISTKKPKYLLLENVKNLVGKKFKPDFDKWLEWLESQGYSNYWQVLNAKDYGVPQNRERVFVVSILREETYEFPSKSEKQLALKDILDNEIGEEFYYKDNRFNRLKEQVDLGKISETNGIKCVNPRKVDGSQAYQQDRVYLKEGIVPSLCASLSALNVIEYSFPEPFPLEVKLKNILEDEVDEKFIMSKDYTDTYVTKGAESSNDIQVDGNILRISNDQRSRVYNPKGISPCLDTMQGGHTQPKIIEYVDGEVRVKEATKLGYKVAEEGDSINIEHPNSTTRRGRVGKQVAQTLTTSPQQVTINDYRIRRLTPLECWRLMGIADEDFYKAKSVGISDSQLYKQAGNAIVVDVLYYIFKNMFKEKQLELF